MSRLSKSYIDKIQPPAAKPDGAATQAFYRDSQLSGFGLRVGSGGTKAFFVETRIDGRVKRMSIGKYGHITPEQARNSAKQLLGEIASGSNPVAEKLKEKAKIITLGAALDDYLVTRKNLKPRTIENYRGCMESCLADWQNLKLASITKDMVQIKHEELGRRAPARANNAMRVLRAVFNHAIERYENTDGTALFSVNPVDRLSRNRAWYSVERRQTLIKPHQLKDWYQATLKLDTEVTRDYLLFLLFTGLRKMEAASLRWENIDFIDLTITVPDTKNNYTHILPASSFLAELLQRRKSLSDNSVWVFPSPIRDGEHLKEPRTACKRVAELSGVDFTLHDLRRTFITIAESLDIPAYALKRLLNHRDPNDVTAGYIVSGIDRIRKPMTEITLFIEAAIMKGATNV